MWLCDVCNYESIIEKTDFIISCEKIHIMFLADLTPWDTHPPWPGIVSNKIEVRNVDFGYSIHAMHVRKILFAKTLYALCTLRTPSVRLMCE